MLHECLLRLTKRFGYFNILKDSKNILWQQDADIWNISNVLVFLLKDISL